MESQSPSSYYQQHGYFVLEKAIPSELIDQFFVEYEKLKKSKLYFFRAQDTNQAERVTVNSEGFMDHSIYDPSYLHLRSGMKTATRKLLCTEKLIQGLKDITGQSTFTLWQSMFFDKSTGTVAHQDHYYLDTASGGGVVGVWIALEDIGEESGPFYVVPGSHKLGAIDIYNKYQDIEVFTDDLRLPEVDKRLFYNHAEYVEKSAAFMKQVNLPMKPFHLKKGDVIFWHSLLLHGSYPNKDPKFSRKSITAHFFPSHEKIIAHGRKLNPWATTPSPYSKDVLFFNKTDVLEEWTIYLKCARDFVSRKVKKALLKRPDRPRMYMRD